MDSFATSFPPFNEKPTIENLRPDRWEGLRLTFANGHFIPELSDRNKLPKGMILGNVRHVAATNPAFVESFLARHGVNPALLTDGAFVYIPKKTVLETPIEILFLTDAPREGTAYPKNVIVLEEESQATIVERYTGSGRYSTNAVTEMFMAPSSILEHYKWQEEAEEAIHTAATRVYQDRSSQLTSHSITLGGKLSRNDLSSVLQAEGVGCFFNGLYLAHGAQQMENHTTIDHSKPYGTSVELYKGILDDRAQAVFDGKVIVRPQAQKTNARQSNKNLLLSNDASVNTQPILEILANDVKCQHGATIGRLDEQALFYLRGRGIGKKEAQSLLTVAFARDVLTQMKLESVRAPLEDRIYRRLMNKESHS